jgi:hypothetical protein
MKNNQIKAKEIKRGKKNKMKENSNQQISKE